MNVLIAPDSMKGALSAIEAAEAMARGVRRALPTARLDLLPVADGGEGTVDSLIAAVGGTRISVLVHDPLGREIDSFYGVLPDGTAVVEIAAAAGLTLVAEEERDIWKSSTYGVGELMRHALDEGRRSFVIGLGGSATNDGGLGMLQALGARLFDDEGCEIQRVVPETCARLAKIDLAELHPHIRDAAVRVACDVSNPLCGPTGATAVYGPQKGVRPDWIGPLDHLLERIGDALSDACGFDVSQISGAGAAGGLGATFVGGLGAQLVRGIDLVLDITSFDQRLRSADVVLTGEGRTDAQTAFGKVVVGIANRAKVTNVPVFCLSGAITDEARSLYDHGVTSMFSIAQGPCSLDDAMRHAADWLEQTTEAAMRVLAARNS